MVAALIAIPLALCAVARAPVARPSGLSRASLRMQFVTHYEELPVTTGRTISLVDITKGAQGASTRARSPCARPVPTRGTGAAPRTSPPAADVAAAVERSGCKEGVVTVLSKHSTVSVTINEMEPRFVDDVRQFLLKLAPKEYPYLHNDLDYRCAMAAAWRHAPSPAPLTRFSARRRAGPPGWPGGDEAWRSFRAGEQVNAHSHLISMLMGTSESIPVHEGKLSIGTFQNVIVIDADGPLDGPGKKRTIVLQVQGSD